MIPKPSVWMIRLSLLYLFISAGIGGMLLAHKAIDIHPMLWGFLPIHYELAIWGWLVQFVIGTAYWMFPKKLEGERRGPLASAWGMVFIFNAGLLILATSTFFPDMSWNPVAGRSLIAISILIFATLIWQRVLTYRNT